MRRTSRGRRRGRKRGGGRGGVSCNLAVWLGVRASCLSGNFGILQTPAPPSSTAVVGSTPTPPGAGGTTLLGSLCPPSPLPPPEGLPRLLLTDRTKLAFPVSPKHWNCTNTLRILETATRLLYAIYGIESYALLKRWLSRDGFQVNTQRINNKFTRLCSHPRGARRGFIYISRSQFINFIINFFFFEKRAKVYFCINIYIIAVEKY